MNTNKKVNSIRLRRAQHTLLGKAIRRLAGEETGAVMMEYVIVAVMIAAAVAVAAWLFGAQIMGMFGVAGDAALGRDQAAQQNINALQQAKPGQNTAADAAAKAFPVAAEESTVTAGN